MPTLNRRSFLATLAASAACSQEMTEPEVETQAPEPILDLHTHTRHLGRTNDQLIAHEKGLGVTKSVLLPGAGWLLERIGDNEECAALLGSEEHDFVLFVNADPAEPHAIETLSTYLDRGGIGIGEQKFAVAVDSNEMRAVFDLARDRRIPVLLHFEHEKYNLGIENLSKILEAYPDVNFIGHAQTWWGNISADLDPTVMYPKGPVKPGGLTDRLLADYPNIYGDLAAGSGLNAMTRDEEFTRGFLDRHADKLIWGSDCPCHDGKGAGRRDGRCIGASCLDAVRRLAPSKEVLGKVLFGNGARVLALASA